MWETRGPKPRGCAKQNGHCSARSQKIYVRTLSATAERPRRTQMQIQYNGGRILFVPTDMGRDLIARKLAVEVKPAPKPTPLTTWEIRQSPIPEQGPYVAAHCETCSLNACCGTPKAAHTIKFLHCGIVESIPPHILKQYERAFGNTSRP